MKKIIKISGKDYTMKSSAYTQFKYKNDTGRKLMQDINTLTKIRTKNKGEILEDLDEFLEILLRITFTLIEEADSDQVKDFDDFLKNIDEVLTDDEWINEVMELAVFPISGGTKAAPKELTK